MTEIERYEAQAPIGGNPAHLRLSIEDCWRVAQFLAASGMFQNGRQKMSAEECMAIIMVGQGLGIAPGVAMLNFHMIEGRPEMSAFLQGYFIKTSHYDYRAVHERNEDGDYVACKVSVIDKNTGEVVGESLFTLRDAQNAGLIRQGGNYQKYAGNMLLARAMSNAMAWHAPDSVPIRVYNQGEIGGRDAIGGEEQGVVAVEGEQQVRPAQVEEAVEAALAAEEVIEDADVEVEGEQPLAVAPIVALETRVRGDLPGLPQADKDLIKKTVADARKPWGFASIMELMVEADFDDVAPWIEYLRSMSTAHPGVTGTRTGSQTEAVITDAQMRLLRAKGTEAGLSEPERKAFLKKFAQVDSSKDVKAKDLDDLLQVLADIEDGGEQTKMAYLGSE